MSKGEIQQANQTLLVYLPCYLDYQLSLAQAKKIRSIKQQLKKKIDLNIEVMISCNGVDFSENEKAQLLAECDYLNVFPFGISGDINITQGFMHSLRLNADYLWILSSNDEVSDTFIETIYENLVKKNDVNVLVGCTSENLGSRRVASVFDRENRDIPFGLISAVVYRTRDMNRNFDSGVQMNWTGWGQLAVIEASCIALSGLDVQLVRESELYARSTRKFEDQEEEEKRVRNGYSHSFFGMPIVIHTLHVSSKRKRREYLNGWLKSNWYLINYFLNTDFKLWNSHVASNQIWLRNFSFAALKSASVQYRLLFRVAKTVDIYSVRKYRFFKWVRGKISD